MPTLFLLTIVAAIPSAMVWGPHADEMEERDRFIAAKLMGQPVLSQPEAALEVIADKQSFVHGKNGHALQRNMTWQDRPLQLDGQDYYSGLYTHANMQVNVSLPGPARTFTARVGLDTNDATKRGQGSVEFHVTVDGAEDFTTGVLRGGDAPRDIQVELGGADEFVLQVTDADDGIVCDAANWADARVTLTDGRVIFLGGPKSGEFSTDPPFSFHYDGKHSRELLPHWKLTRSARPIDENRTAHVLTYWDPETKLEVRCEAVAYQDFPTVEWTLYFKNNGSSTTPILSEIQGLDVVLSRGQTGEFTIHHHAGSLADANDYRPYATELGPNQKMELASLGGRPSSNHWPYFNVDWRGAGAIVVLGWPGQWATSFVRTADRQLRVAGGQELTHLRLDPGEEIRAPLCVLQFWRGDRVRAQNIWRRWMRTHNLPRPGGEPITAQWGAASSVQYAEMMLADKQSQINFIDRYLDQGLKLDYWWMDFGWYYYKGDDQRYEADQERFPGGLRPITDYAHSRGVNSIVWFEIENVSPLARIRRQHPDWTIGGDGINLLDLGNPAARRWVIDHVHGQVVKEGIDVFRSDYNVDPLAFWRNNDPPERQGITENKYISGYLEFWDELQRRQPGLRIDSCSSGGKRNDLETMRRAVPLWRSDYNNVGYVVFDYRIAPHHDVPTNLQNQTYGLASWLPYFGTAARDDDLYIFRSGLCPWVLSCWDVRRDDLDYDLLRKMMGEFRQVADNFLGDYYPLTQYSQSDEVWVAWQFDRPEVGQGVVQAFRRGHSPYEIARFQLRGLQPDETYLVRNLDSDCSTRCLGRELMRDGLDVSLPQRPAAATITYELVNAAR